MATHPDDVACPRCQADGDCPQWCMDADGTVSWRANLSDETIARFRQDGFLAALDGARGGPEVRPLFQRALNDIPPGFRGNGPTVTALRAQWHNGYGLGSRCRRA